MVSIKEVANLAGVSIGTVSNVINNKETVSYSIKERVEKAIKELGYIPKAHAQSLKSKKTNTIGVIIPSITDDYFSRIYTGLQNYILSKGYNIHLVVTGEIPSVEDKALVDMLRQGVLGIVIVSCNAESNSKSLKLIEDKNLPVVFIDRMVDVSNANYVSFDYREIGRYLCKEILKNGYKKIALLTGPISYSNEDDFVNAFKSCYMENRKTSDGLYLFQTSLHKFCSFKFVCNFMYGKEKDALPDIIITTSKTLFKGIEEALAIMRISLIKHIEVISLEEQNWLEMIKPRKVKTVFRPALKLGKKAGKILIENINSIKIHTPKRLVLTIDIQESKEIEYLNKEKCPISNHKRLTLYMLKDISTKAIKALINDFNRNNFEIDIIEYGIDDLYRKILESRKLSSLNKPDIFMVDIPWIPFLSKNSYLLDITEFVESDKDCLKGYIQTVLETYSKYENSFYCLPFNLSIQLLFYREDLFRSTTLKRKFEDRYKIELNPPQTWDEYNAVAQYFTKSYNSESPVKYGNTIGGATSSSIEYLPRLWSYGGNVFNENGEIVLNSYQGLVALRNYVDGHQYAKPKSINHWWWNQIETFAKGEAAMMVMYVNHTSSLVDRDYSNIVGKFGVGSIPGNIPVLGGWSLAVNSESNNKEVSYDFIKWASSARIAVPYSVLGGCTPHSTLYQAEELLDLYPYLTLAEKDFKKSRKRTYPLDNLNNFRIDERSYEKIISSYISKAVTKQLTCEDALEKAAMELEKSR